MTAPKRPAGLGKAGAALWKDLSGPFEFGADEVVILAAVCRQADDIASLEALLAEQGGTVIGSTGQPRLNPIYAELRQARLALGKLIEALHLPDDGEAVLTPAQKRARKAANVRWHGDPHGAA